MRYTDSGGETLTVQEGFSIGGGTSTLGVNQNWDLGTVTVGVAQNYQLNACCVPSYTWSAAGGSWPPGITITTGGMLTGTPTTPGVYTFLVQVADGANAANVGIRQLVWTVTPMAITTGYTLPYGNVGTSYSQALTATGGSGALNWVLTTGSLLPPGLTLNPTTGVISGTPTGSGYFTFKLTVSDGSGHIYTASFCGEHLWRGRISAAEPAAGAHAGTVDYRHAAHAVAGHRRGAALPLLADAAGRR